MVLMQKRWQLVIKLKNSSMNYRDRYVTVDLNDEEFAYIKQILSRHQDYDSTEIEGVRKCDVAFVQDQSLTDIVLSYTNRVNEAAKWFFDINFLEPLQLTRYREGDRYDWHQDESEWYPHKREDERIRKISFTLLLNDDFEGGEFSLINQVVPMTTGQMIFFHSDDWHQVAEVTKGERNSLVGWVQGPSWR
jgi:PKHD-type hydroxylase